MLGAGEGGDQQKPGASRAVVVLVPALRSSPVSVMAGTCCCVVPGGGCRGCDWPTAARGRVGGVALSADPGVFWMLQVVAAVPGGDMAIARIFPGSGVMIAAVMLPFPLTRWLARVGEGGCGMRAKKKTRSSDLVFSNVAAPEGFEPPNA